MEIDFKIKGNKKRNLQFFKSRKLQNNVFFSVLSSHKRELCCRRLGLPWVSAVDDLMSVRKALAAGLFSNAAQYVSTTVESRDKEHTGVDMYHLVRSTGHGQSHISPAFHSLHFNLHHKVWGGEPVVTHQTSWIESTSALPCSNR